MALLNVFATTVLDAHHSYFDIRYSSFVIRYSSSDDAIPARKPLR